MQALQNEDPAVNLSNSLESSLDALVTKRLLETVQKTEVKRWNHKIESMVLKKLLPDLVEKFSNLSPAEGYIKKSVERAIKHVRLLYRENGAIGSNGTINVPMMIQNCIETNKDQSTFEVYNQALLEAKTLSGLFIEPKEKVEKRVAKAIFSIGQHACTSKGPKTPFERMELIDYLILEQQFDLLSSYEVLSYEELKEKMLTRLKSMESIAHMDHLPVLIASVHAHNLAANLDFEKKWGKKNLDALKQFVSSQMEMHPSMHPIELVNRILFLYHVSTQKDKKAEIVRAAGDYLTSLSTDLYSPTLHRLGHEVYAFINNEIRKIKSGRPLTTLKEILLEVQQMFSFADELAAILPQQKELLEIFLFYHFFDHHPLMQNLEDSHTDLLSRQLARVAVEKGQKEFRETVHTTYDRVIRYKKLEVPLAQEDNFFREETFVDKIAHFASQNELVMDQFKPSAEHPLFRLVRKLAAKDDTGSLTKEELSSILEKFFSSQQLLTAYSKYLEEEIIFFSKIFWYNQMKRGQKTPLERFYQWHYQLIKQKNPGLKGRELIKKMEELTTKTLPLMPSYRQQNVAI
ncbi:MAG: hypothetical protein FJZ61_01320 [Chlamydiae bacterium]|nr:hypothetical protein [Chlamydiota bacterium]